jgi:ribulose-5-phosphate 4-epimerase/fuculose-1-phosphate aldolase
LGKIKKMEEQFLNALNQLGRFGFFTFNTSLSFKASLGKMIINRKNAPFCKRDPMLKVSYLKRELRWEEGPKDISIHSAIYRKVVRVKVLGFLNLPNFQALSASTPPGEEIPFFDRWSLQYQKEIKILRFPQWNPQNRRELFGVVENYNVIVIPSLGVYFAGRSCGEIVEKALTLERGAEMALKYLFIRGRCR